MSMHLQIVKLDLQTCSLEKWKSIISMAQKQDAIIKQAVLSQKALSLIENLKSEDDIRWIEIILV